MRYVFAAGMLIAAAVAFYSRTDISCATARGAAIADTILISGCRSAPAHDHRF